MTTNTPQIEDRHVEKARESLAVEYEAVGYSVSAEFFRSGDGDDHCSLIVLARLIAEHEAAQPTREQELEAMGEAFAIIRGSLYCRPDDMLDAYKSALARIMAPKPVDPLVEALKEAGFGTGNENGRMDRLREALAARGLKIVEDASNGVA